MFNGSQSEGRAVLLVRGVEANQLIPRAGFKGRGERDVGGNTKCRWRGSVKHGCCQDEESQTPLSLPEAQDVAVQGLNLVSCGHWQTGYGAHPTGRSSLPIPANKMKSLQINKA
jgi:hypothetical protein